jgi:membrane-bound lytic murein transglycosylase B
MTSSWAGAFGHTQFVPTTYLERAVDGDGDGKRDVWDSPADALASTANYLKQSGWRMDEAWGEEVKLPDGFAFDQADAQTRKSLDEWGRLGVTNMSGEPLMGADTAFVFIPAGYRGPAFMVTGNFNAILKYNFATSYALAIGMLSDRLKGDAPLMANWPLDELPLDTRQSMALQEGLTVLGFDTGGADGMFGQRSRAALRDYQKARGIPADGFATAAILTKILNERAAAQR